MNPLRVLGENGDKAQDVDSQWQSSRCPQLFPGRIPSTAGVIHDLSTAALALGKLTIQRKPARPMKTRRIRSGSDGGAVRRDAAEALGIEALSFLAAEPERLGRFLALAGVGPDELRAAATAPHFLAGVLDHLVGDERLLIEFAAHAQIKPEAVMRAAIALGGGVWEQDVP